MTNYFLCTKFSISNDEKTYIQSNKHKEIKYIKVIAKPSTLIFCINPTTDIIHISSDIYLNTIVLKQMNNNTNHLRKNITADVGLLVNMDRVRRLHTWKRL